MARILGVGLIPKDEIPEVARRLRKALRGEGLEREDRSGRLVPLSEIRDAIFVPKYYDPEVHQALEELKKTRDLVPFGKLVKDGVLDVRTGVEVRKLAYGTGTIPFIRTSDLSNWEIKIDPKHGWKEKCPDLQPEDILMVRDGTYLVGTTAMITKEDITRRDADGRPMILFQAELYRIRVKRNHQAEHAASKLRGPHRIGFCHHP